jgi:peroxiredoxin Q/BCP
MPNVLSEGDKAPDFAVRDGEGKTVRLKDFRGKKHKKFAAKYDLPFRLLADTERAISESYGTYGEKKFMGRTYMGNHRMTFLIDEKGKIRKIFSKVKPEDHAEEVLEAFK